MRSNELVFNKLNEINLIMQIYATNANAAVEFVDSHEDMVLELGTSQGATPQIFYYANLQDTSYSWYTEFHAIWRMRFQKKKQDWSSTNPILFSEEKVRIDFGSEDNIINISRLIGGSTANMAKEIYAALERGIAD